MVSDIIPKSKICSVCKEEKPLSDFYPAPRYKFGVTARCRPCTMEATNTWRAANAEKTRESAKRHYYKDHERSKELQRKRKMRSQYGLEPEEFDQMLVDQDGVCAVCGGVQSNGRRLAIDHNHETGEVRGLLCDSCNHGLGNFRDDPHLMKTAIKYLRRTSNGQ